MYVSVRHTRFRERKLVVFKGDSSGKLDAYPGTLLFIGVEKHLNECVGRILVCAPRRGLFLQLLNDY